MDLFIFIALWFIMMLLAFAFLPRLDRLVRAAECLAVAAEAAQDAAMKEKP